MPLTNLEVFMQWLDACVITYYHCPVYLPGEAKLCILIRVKQDGTRIGGPDSHSLEVYFDPDGAFKSMVFAALT